MKYQFGNWQGEFTIRYRLVAHGEKCCMALHIEEPRINNGLDFKWLDGAVKPSPTEQLQQDMTYILSPKTVLQ